MRAGITPLSLVLLLGTVSDCLAAEPDSMCVGCHEYMSPELSAPVDEWRRSVHAQAQVSCDACHGGDPFEADMQLAMDESTTGFIGVPGWAEVPELCGACHVEISLVFSQSIMGGRIPQGERVAVCTTCHMTEGHAVGDSVPDRILTEERCGGCHDAGRAIRVRDILEELRERVGRARGELGAIRHMIDTSVQVHEVAEIEERVVMVAHTYDLTRISEVATVAKERLERVTSATLRLTQEARFRRRLGVVVVGFLLLTSAGVILLGRAEKSD